jgi:2-polyprenyl-6-methoxyphenol hydroxylase-like FAD-dependent oxidoreductase
MHALMLKSIGHTVIVLEARSEQQLQARAAGLSIWPNAQRLLTTSIPKLDLDSITVHNRSMQIMTGDGLLVGEVPVADDVRTTGWNLVHDLLRKTCETNAGGDGPTVRILTNKTVLEVYEKGTNMVVEYTGEDGAESIIAGRVIAADGARSYVRSLVLPEVNAEYVGYLAWRGNFPEVEAPDGLEGVLAGKLCNFKLDDCYILT